MIKFELDSLQAESAALNHLLSMSTEEDDPIGHLQFKERLEEISSQIEEISARQTYTAQIAAFFGGSPVIGSHGIYASFLAKATDGLQDIVDKQAAAEEFGSLAGRGPVRNRKNTRLMVTDVIRGSFGIVLEEFSPNADLTETALKRIVDEVAHLIAKIGTASMEEFSEAVEHLDERSLQSFKNFFELLADSDATLRLVFGEQDVLLDHDSVSLGRDRISKLKISELEHDDFIGKLYWIPAHKKFELRLLDTNEVIYGSVASELMKAYEEGSIANGSEVVGKIWKAKVRVRVVEESGRRPRNIYTLLGLEVTTN